MLWLVLFSLVRGSRGDCGSSFTACEADVVGCFACATQVMLFEGDDDDVVLPVVGASCENIMSFLNELGLCKDLPTVSQNLVCDVWAACADDDDDGFGGGTYYDAIAYRADALDDDDFAVSKSNCSSCDVEKPWWLGDGWCDDVGCYNTAACGYDGGDCCEETCEDSPTKQCSDFVCRDPEHQGCGDRAKTRYSGNMMLYSIFDVDGAYAPVSGDGRNAVCLADGCYAAEIEPDEKWSAQAFEVEGFVEGVGPAACYFGSACETSCSSQTCDFFMIMKDAAYDGWGTTYEIADGAVSYTGTLAYGHMGVDSLCLSPGCYTLTVGAGWFPEEVSWQLGRRDVGPIASGGAPFACQFPVEDACANTCGYGCYALDVKGTLLITSEDKEFGTYSDETTQACLSEDECYLFEISGGSFSIGDVYGTKDCYFGAGCDAEKNVCETRTLPPTPSYDDSCPYQTVTARLYDSWGDGWNGARIRLNDGLKDETLETGSYGEFEWCLEYPACYAVEVTAGEWHDEVSWQITTPRSDPRLSPLVIASGAAPEVCGFALPAGYRDGDPPTTCDLGCTRQGIVEDDWRAEDDFFFFYEYYSYSKKEEEDCDFEDLKQEMQVVNDFYSCGTFEPDDPFDESLWVSESYDWQELDEFEASENPSEAFGFLAAATKSQDEIVRRLATMLYNPAFCGCVAKAGTVPECSVLALFEAVLREAHEACDALDTLYCGYLGIYVDACPSSMIWDAHACHVFNTTGCPDTEGAPPPPMRYACDLAPDQAAYLQAYRDGCFPITLLPEGSKSRSTTTLSPTTTALVVVLAILFATLLVLVAVWLYKRRTLATAKDDDGEMGQELSFAFAPLDEGVNQEAAVV